MAEGSKAREISLGDDFGDVVVKANGAQVKISADGSIHSLPTPANDIAAKVQTTHEIGDVALAGDHKGEIYGGIYLADKKPIWFLAAPKLMNHYNAAAWATERGGDLPTRAQGKHLDAIKDKGAFKELFNRSESVWLAEPYTYDRDYAWCQRLSDGGPDSIKRNVDLPVLCVVR